jgi:hypothetical protein
MSQGGNLPKPGMVLCAFIVEWGRAGVKLSVFKGQSRQTKTADPVPKKVSKVAVDKGH